MSDPMLAIYVRQALTSGLKPEALRKAMHVSGWSDAEIDGVFAFVGPVRPRAAHAAKARANGVAGAYPPTRRLVGQSSSLVLAAAVMGFIVVQTGVFLHTLGM